MRDIQKNLMKALIVIGSLTFVLDLLFCLLAAGGSSYFLFPPLWDLALLPIWLLTIIHLHLEKRNQLRSDRLQNMDESRRKSLESSGLFDQSFEDVLLDRQSHLFYKRWLPFFVGLSLIALAFLAYTLTGDLFKSSRGNFDTSLEGSLFLFRAFLSFIAARYLLGLSMALGQGYVSAIGGLGLSHSIQCIVITLLVSLRQSAPVEGPLRIILLGILVAYILEVLLRSILKCYATKASSLPPFCTLLVLFQLKRLRSSGTLPVVEYQFGWNLGSLFKKSILSSLPAWSVLFILILITGSSVGIVEEGQVGFVEILGKKSRTLKPGLYLKLPWPVAYVRLVDVGRVHRLDIGHREHHDRVLWKDEHAEHENLYISQDGSTSGSALLPLEVYALVGVLSYRITSPELYTYGFSHPENLIQQEAHRQLTLACLSSTGWELMSQRRAHLEEHIFSELKTILESQLKVGITLTHFAIVHIHPPKDTVDAFESSIAARYEKERTINEALAWAGSLSSTTLDHEKIILSGARARRDEITSSVYGDLSYFEAIRPLAKSFPYFLERQKLSRLEKSLRLMRKIMILGKVSKEIDILNLEESSNPDFLDLTMQVKEDKP